MEQFYRDIDCLLHAPLTEAFGLVAIEAASLGCPVIAAAVDGLPEAVADGVSGYTVAPTLPLAEYVGLGGAHAGFRRSSTIPRATRSLRRRSSIRPRSPAPSRGCSRARRRSRR